MKNPPKIPQRVGDAAGETAAPKVRSYARMMELVDLTDSKSVAVRRVGSSPTLSTITQVCRVVKAYREGITPFR